MLHDVVLGSFRDDAGSRETAVGRGDVGGGGAVLNGAADARGDGRYGALCGGGRDHVVRRVAARVSVDNEVDLAGWCDVASN